VALFKTTPRLVPLRRQPLRKRGAQPSWTERDDEDGSRRRHRLQEQDRAYISPGSTGSA
jgi:hypothetical protein